MTEISNDRKIKEIQSSSVHQITSGQVVIDLASGVKELVENSIDANATIIEIKFKNYGLDSVEVIDNGDGIAKDDFEGIGRKHYTSKLRTFENLTMVTTFGFRGEAISSLCALAHVQVVTCTQADAPLATKLELDINGEIKSKSVSPGKKGTTITISDIFHSLPVRRKDLQKNIKREFIKTTALLQAYAVICLGVRIIVSNTLSKGKKSVMFVSNANKSLKDNIANIYGVSSIESLMPLNISFEMATTSSILQKFKHSDANTAPSTVQVEGYISKPIFGKGRNSSDRQLCYINSRPCLLPQVAKAVNDIYRSFNSTQFPFFVLNLKLDTARYDVNVSPDKRTILLHGETMLIELIRENLSVEFEEAGHSIPKNTAVSGPSAGRTQGRLFSSMISRFTNGNTESEEPETSETTEEREDPKDESSDNLSKEKSESLTPRRSLRNEESTYVDPDTDLSDDELFVTGRSQELMTPTPRTSTRSAATLVDFSALPSTEKLDFNEPVQITLSSQKGKTEYVKLNRPSGTSRKSSSKGYKSRESMGTSNNRSLTEFGKVLRYVKPGDNETEGSEDENEREDEDKEMGDVEVESSAPSPPVAADEPTEQSNAKKPVFSQRAQASYRNRTHNLDLAVPVSLRKIQKGFKQLQKIKSAALKPKRTTSTKSSALKRLSDLTVSDIAGSEELVEGILNLSIHKEDFLKMELVGQFNLGFILVTKINENTGQKDLFIVDQHASDEIYNFERLQRETIIQKQPLVVPLLLDLTAMDELTLSSHLNIFESNGFKITVDEEAPPGKKCRLQSVPLSKSTTFDVKDIHELIYLIDTHPGNQFLKCSKLRSMFAMRACRSSIMIGKSLAPKVMIKTVRHLSELNKPWNCPHGRPTMRHLVNLGQFEGQVDDFI